MSAVVVRKRYSRLVVAPASALGMIRAGVHGVFLIAVLTDWIFTNHYLETPGCSLASLVEIL
jgi:hypothetical protein